MTGSRSRFDADIEESLPAPPSSVEDPHRRNKKKAKSKIPIRTTSWVEKCIRIKNADSGTVDPMSFSQRRYLRRVYDTPSERRLLLTSRQTEKCVSLEAQISMENGSLKRAGSIEVGDRVATMLADGTIANQRVTWVSDDLKKPGLRIETRQGHVIEVATTHPMRIWDDWVEAGKLRVGDRLAAVRRCGIFTATSWQSEERIRLTAYLIGDGSISGPVVGFTAVPGPVLNEFVGDVTSLGGTYRTYAKATGRAVDVRLRHLPQLMSWLEADGLRGTRSADKFLPSWVFDLSEEQTSLFVNRLWSTDGHVNQRTRSNYNIVYCSMSKLLIEQLQALLWKFQIPTRIRTNWPSIYKRRGEKRLAYLLSVETKDGIYRFLSRIGALGKSESVPFPECESNNNLDTFPHQVEVLVKKIIASGHLGRRSNLFAKGLARGLDYAPTAEKLWRYVDAFREDERFDQALVSQLEEYLLSDLYWDRIKTITPIDTLGCVDFTVQGTHNFVADGLVTHNSTSLGNLLMSLSGMRSLYTSLFVTPSAMQTKVFSTTRLDGIVEVSPMMRSLTHRSLINNLLEKEYVNKSKIYLRYAFLSADRIRGLSVNALFVDEIQDILQDLLPVIEETTSHHKNPLFIYSGTPKTLDNTIEKYWSGLSTMSEWVIPCERHGTPNNPASWHWNILGPKNIGKYGPICDRCGGPLNPEHPMADWCEMNPGAQFEGFRICRLMVPWFFKDPEKWKEILLALERYPTAQFMNEVMALSYDSGEKPLSRHELIRCCDDAFTNDEDQAAELGQTYDLYAGVDWHAGGTQGAAYTVLFVGGYVRPDAGFQYVYAKRFTGPQSEPEEMMKELIRLLRKFRIKYIAADFGAGFMQNKQLSSVFGAKKVFPIHYMGKLTAKMLYKPQLHRFLVFRSLVMADIFQAIKKMKLRFFSWDKFREPFANDMLSIRAEYNEIQKLLMYIKIPGIPDDSFHAAGYALLASLIDVKRPDIFAPIQEAGEDAAAVRAEEDLHQLLEDMALPIIDGPVTGHRG